MLFRSRLVIMNHKLESEREFECGNGEKEISRNDDKNKTALPSRNPLSDETSPLLLLTTTATVAKTAQLSQ